jgi:hypothetical protein
MGSRSVPLWDIKDDCCDRPRLVSYPVTAAATVPLFCAAFQLEVVCPLLGSYSHWQQASLKIDIDLTHDHWRPTKGHISLGQRCSRVGLLRVVELDHETIVAGGGEFRVQSE